MIALEAKKSIQTTLGVTPDGDPGKITEAAWVLLKNTANSAPWPPVEPAEFAGLTESLRSEYQRLYDTMELRWEDDHKDEPGLEAIYEGLRAEYRGVLAAIRANRARYEKISQLASAGAIPWDFIAIIHNLECGLSFKKHLHNGDPLTARTVLVPAGRPAKGTPPFTFEASAIDALTMPGKAFHLETDWTTPATLFRLEGYNGFGYRKYHPTVLTPYLWSGSNHYTRGKYISDGGSGWSDSAVSKQLGTALLLKALRAA